MRRARATVAAALLVGLTGCTDSRPATQPAARTPGGQIAFVRVEATAGAGQKGQIWLEQADGSHARAVLPAGGDDDRSPWLSPDGRSVAFTRRTTGQPDRIVVVRTDGSGLRLLAPSGCPDICSDAVDGPAWSPDGRSIAFSRSVFHGPDRLPAGVEIWVVAVGSGRAHRVTQGSSIRVGDRLRSQDRWAGWSPDGTRVLFVHEEHATAAGLDQYSVMTVAPDGTHLQPVTPNDVNAGQPAWAPDGSLIAFQSPPDEEGVTKALYTIRPDGTGMTSLTNTLDTNDSEHPTWSPDSRQIAFAHVPQGSTGGPDLYVVGRDGSDPHPIDVTTASESAPSWGRAPG